MTWTQVENDSAGVVLLADGDKRAYRGASKVLWPWTDEASRRLAYLLSRTHLTFMPAKIVPVVPQHGPAFLSIYHHGTGRTALVLLPQPHSLFLALREVQRKTKGKLNGKSHLESNQ